MLVFSQSFFFPWTFWVRQGQKILAYCWVSLIKKQRIKERKDWAGEEYHSIADITYLK